MNDKSTSLKDHRIGSYPIDKETIETLLVITSLWNQEEFKNSPLRKRTQESKVVTTVNFEK